LTLQKLKCDNSNTVVEEGLKGMLTPIKAIRANCLRCSVNQPSEVKKCVIPDCPLFPYRFGKNPNRKGIGGLGRVSKEKRELS